MRVFGWWGVLLYTVARADVITKDYIIQATTIMNDTIPFGSQLNGTITVICESQKPDLSFLLNLTAVVTLNLYGNCRYENLSMLDNIVSVIHLNLQLSPLIPILDLTRFTDLTLLIIAGVNSLVIVNSTYLDLFRISNSDSRIEAFNLVSVGELAFSGFFGELVIPNLKSVTEEFSWAGSGPLPSTFQARYVRRLSVQNSLLGEVVSLPIESLGYMLLSGNLNVRKFLLPFLNQTGCFSILDNPVLQTFEAPLITRFDVSEFPEVYCGNAALWLRKVPGFNSLILPRLMVIENIFLDGTALKDLDSFTNCVDIQSVLIRNNPVLHSAQGLRHIANISYLDIMANPLLGGLNLCELGSIRAPDTIKIGGAPSLFCDNLDQLFSASRFNGASKTFENCNITTPFQNLSCTSNTSLKLLLPSLFSSPILLSLSSITKLYVPLTLQTFPMLPLPFDRAASVEVISGLSNFKFQPQFDRVDPWPQVILNSNLDFKMVLHPAVGLDATYNVAVIFADPKLLNVSMGTSDCIQSNNTLVECPTTGGGEILLTFSYLPLGALSIAIDRALCDVTLLGDGVVRLVLPPLTGLGLPITVVHALFSQVNVNMISYRAATVSTLISNGCAPIDNVSVLDLIDCKKEGGYMLTIRGSSFGSQPPLVLVGEHECTNVNTVGQLQEEITCIMPGGSLTSRHVTILQALGQATFLAGSVSYALCPPGSIETGNNCTLCSPGFFSNAPGQFDCHSCVDSIASTPGAVQCEFCSDHLYAHLNGTVCIPRVGYMWAHDVLIACPVGGQCVEGLASPIRGWWQAQSSVPPVFVECLNPSACLETGCLMGQEGALCGVCAEGYGTIGLHTCTRCTHDAADAVVIAVLVLVFVAICFTLLFVKTRRKHRSHELRLRSAAAAETGEVFTPPSHQKAMKQVVQVVKVGVSTLQVNGIAYSFAVGWPGAISGFLDVQNVAGNIGTALVSLGCVYRSSPISAFFAQLLVISFVPLFGLLIVAAVPLWFRIQRLTPPPGVWINGCLLVLFLVHPGVSQHVLFLFRCTTVHQTMYLRADMAVECLSPQHLFWLIILGVPMLILFVGGMPLVIWLVLLADDRKLRRATLDRMGSPLMRGGKRSDRRSGNMELSDAEEQAVMREPCGIIFARALTRCLPQSVKQLDLVSHILSGYKPEYWYWFLVVMLRKFGIVLVAVVFSAGGPQILAALLVMVIAACVHFYAQPHNHAIVNFLEGWGICSSLVTFSAAAFLQFANENTKTFLAVIMMLSMLSFLAAFLHTCLVLSGMYRLCARRPQAVPPPVASIDDETA